MSSYLLKLLGNLREPETVHDGAHILSALSAIAEHGYLLAAQGELSGMDGAAEVALADSVTRDGITEALRDHLAAFAAGGERFFAATAHSLTLNGYMGQFNFDIGLSPEDQWLGVFVNDYQFRGWLEGDWGIACFKEFARMLPVVYAQWHPLFIYDFGEAFPETTRADIVALAPRSLYGINLFGPELVERMGRERVLSAPAWRVAPLDDGGAMVITTGNGYAGAVTHDFAAVARHLGLP